MIYSEFISESLEILKQVQDETSIPALSRNCEVMYNLDCIIYNEFNSTFLILNYTLCKPGDLP